MRTVTQWDTQREIIVLVPLRGLREAKQRLREALVPDVDDLVRRLARGVITAAAPRRCVVVTEDPETADFAHDLGAQVLISPVASLNGAVQWAYAELERLAEHVVIAHGDLLEPSGVHEMGRFHGVTLVADHHGEGTTVLALPTGTAFRFAYGARSLRRHRDEARRLGLPCRVILGSTLSRDVDVAADLDPDGT